MNLEPIVIGSIKKHGRKVKARKFQFLFTLFLGCAGLVAMVVVLLFSGDRDGKSIVDSIFITVCIALLVIYIAMRIRGANKKFKIYTGKRASATKGLRKFRDALEGVCIGAGVTPPRLVVVRDDNVNAFAFIDELGWTHIAVTEGMLEAPLSIHEINAIMAHELSHVIIGNNIWEPGLSDIEYYPGFFYGTAFFFGAIGALMLSLVLIPKFTSPTGTAGKTLFPVIVLLLLGSIFFIRLLHEYGAFDRLSIKGLDSLHLEDDLLADSITVKITMNPDALESAIRKVRDINESRRTRGPSINGTQPEAPDFLAKYLFVGPPGSITSYHRRTISDETGVMKKSIQVPIKTKKATREPIDERIRNLELIKKDRWPSLKS